MKISIDLDQTLWQHQAFFRAFIRAMQRDGHQVGILTSHKFIHEPADRALMEKRGFPEPDFYIGRRDTGGDYAAQKATAIVNHGIDIHFDDGTAEQVRLALGPRAYSVVSVMPRGEEHEHFE